MTFPTYPDYKASGFDWLPEVPAHWADRKIAREIPFVVGWTPPSGKDEYYDGELPWVTIADMTQMSVEDTKSKISLLAVRDKGAKIVPAGSMLFSFKLSVGKVAFLTIDSYTNEAIAGFLPSGPLDLDYWRYAAPEFIPRYGRENIYGATLLNQELISSVRFFAPARAEQTQIARFLDHETARIDGLIEEQQRLIELLKEKRQAVISHAVTKGLDPTVPMKYSGVEWLGDVPAHWVVSQLKLNTLEMQTGPFGSQLHAEDYVDGGIPLVNPAHMIGGEIIPDSQVTVDEVTWQRLKRHALTAGDIIFARRGELGRCAIVTKEQDGWLCGTGSLKAKLSSQLDAEYAYLLITSKGAVAELSLESKGSTMENLNTETLGRIRLPLPPVTQQKAILEYVHEVSGQFSALVDAAESGISLITERRSALISAAVTGKIDMRGWQPQAPAPAENDTVQKAGLSV